MPNTPEQQRQRAIRNGTWVGERRATAQLCHNTRRSVFQMMWDAEKYGWDEYVPELCDEWLEPSSAGLALMVNDVISELGLRPTDRHRLAPRHGKRMGRDNVRYVIRIAGAAVPDCVCDWSHRVDCPCEWASQQRALDLFEVDGDWFSRGPV